MTRIIAVASGKGGVGKTTTAINLGRAVRHFEQDAIVLDANFSNPNVSLHLGSPLVPITLHDSLRGSSSIRDAVYAHPSGVKVVPASVAFHERDAVNPHQLREVMPGLHGVAETVFLDVAAGIGEHAKAGLKAATEVLVVTNAQTSSVADALKTIKLAQKMGTPVSGVVVTRHVGDKYDMKLQDVERILGHPVIGVIPECSSVRKSHALKHPVVHSHPLSAASRSYKQLAGRILGKAYEEELLPLEKKSLFHVILKHLGLE